MPRGVETRRQGLEEGRVRPKALEHQAVARQHGARLLVVEGGQRFVPQFEAFGAALGQVAERALLGG